MSDGNGGAGSNSSGTGTGKNVEKYFQSTQHRANATVVDPKQVAIQAVAPGNKIKALRMVRPVR